MPIRLTETAINRAIKEASESGRRDLADGGCQGLRLRVTPTGSATWVLACRDRHGRMRRFPLGGYPAIGVSEARNAARLLHTKVKHEGADPIAERRAERVRAAAAKLGIGTLDALLDHYERQKGAKLRSWPEYKASIGRVFGPLLKRPLADLTLADLQLVADGYRAQAQASLSVRCIRPMLKWASSPGRAYVPPDLARISPPATVKRRKRVLSRDELAALLPVLRASDRAYATALRFMLLTLARRQEVASARWRDVDLERAIWTLRETKNDEPHVVPLSHQAIDLLRRLLADGSNQNPDPAGLIFTTSAGAALGNWDRETKALLVAAKLAAAGDKMGDVLMKDGSAMPTRHDLRRTGATMLGEMGELPDIVEASLNHVSIRSALAATYNRSRYRPQVAVALQRLADALDGIEAGGGEVVPLRPVGA